MPVHDTDHLEIHEVCNPTEPAVDTLLYTDGQHGGHGPEVAVATRPDPRVDSAGGLSAYEIGQCVRWWAGERARRLNPTPVVLHDGLVTVEPVEVRLADSESIDQQEQVHLCVLEEETAVEVITWTATVDANVLPTQEPDPTNPMAGLRSSLSLGKVRTANPATVLLNHLDPDHATIDVVARVARVGAIGAMQTWQRLGASATIATLRNLTDALDLDVAETRAQAVDTARRWSQLLWPPDAPQFERRWHMPSVALAHHLEATALALALYPAVPMSTLNWASMTTMWLLSDGRWAQGRVNYETVTDLFSDLADLPSPAWDSLAESFEHDGEEDTQALASLTYWLGRGARAPRPQEFLPLVPTSLPETVRRRIAASAATLAVCRLLGVRRADPLATVLTARSFFDA